MAIKKLKIIRISLKSRLVFGAVLLTFLILAGGSLIYFHFANAGSATLYPGNCLGSWQNPDRAQGQPEAQGPQFISKENSAVFSEGGVKEIYCGSFNGNFSESEIKLIKSVTLKFSWLVRDEKIPETPTSSITIIQPPATSSNELAKDTNYIVNQILNNIHADEVHLIVSTTTSEITITTNKISTTTLSIQTPPTTAAIAPIYETIPAATSSVLEIKKPQTSTSSPTSFWWRKYNFLSADDQVSNTAITISNVVTTTMATTSPLDNPIAPTEDFLKVSYTLDGINWQALGTINKNNWQNISFQIPVYQLEDVKKIQIKIESLPLVNKTPYVYLDGMSLEVGYESGALASQNRSSVSGEQSPPVFNTAVSNRYLGESALSSQANISVKMNNFPDLTQIPNHWADNCFPNTPDHWRIMAVDSHNNYYLGPEHNIDLINPIDTNYTFSFPKSDYVYAAVIWGVGTVDQINKCGLRWLERHFMKPTQFLQITIQINDVRP